MHHPTLAATLLAAAVAAGFAVTACAGPGADPVIDGWPVGGVTSECTSVGCAEMIRVGLAGVDARDPGHAEVVSSEIHSLGTCLDPVTGNQIITAYGGYSPRVLVVNEADGSTHAIGVGGAGIDPTPRVTPWFYLPTSDLAGCASPSPALP
jgi:hypothetical protein